MLLLLRQLQTLAASEGSGATVKGWDKVLVSQKKDITSKPINDEPSSNTMKPINNKPSSNTF